MKTTNPIPKTARGGLAFVVRLMTIAAFTQVGLAQTLPQAWRWSNPTPHGGNVFDMAYGLGVTIQVCERGQIFTSDDLAPAVQRAIVKLHGDVVGCEHAVRREREGRTVHPGPGSNRSGRHDGRFPIRSYHERVH